MLGSMLYPATAAFFPKLMKSMRSKTVLIVNDWAMKFLPQKYRVSNRLVWKTRYILAHLC